MLWLGLSTEDHQVWRAGGVELTLGLGNVGKLTKTCKVEPHPKKQSGTMPTCAN
jgi:hypothetical protein